MLLSRSRVYTIRPHSIRDRQGHAASTNNRGEIQFSGGRMAILVAQGLIKGSMSMLNPSAQLRQHDCEGSDMGVRDPCHPRHCRGGIRGRPLPIFLVSGEAATQEVAPAVSGYGAWRRPRTRRHIGSNELDALHPHMIITRVLTPDDTRDTVDSMLYAALVCTPPCRHYCTSRAATLPARARVCARV
eukprot:9290454-Pyramimonas_sp.AAC.1